jgi:hypothetical protein
LKGWLEACPTQTSHETNGSHSRWSEETVIHHSRIGIMVMKRSSTSRKLGLEQFESRQMMAGNVSVAFSGNHLQINRDRESNGVQI